MKINRFSLFSKILKIIFLFSVVILFYSCSKDDTPVTPTNPADTSTNFKYPYTINSNWFFTTTPSYTFYPDSVRPYLIGADSSIEVGYAIWKNDTIINGINARVLRTNHTSTNHSFNTTETYVQTDTGLVNLTFYPEASFGPFRPVAGYEPFKEIFSIFLSNRDTIANPLNCLKYPLVTGAEWAFRITGPNQVQKKKYLGYEQVQTAVGTFNCMKVQRINYVNNVADTNFVWIDYFSKIGMVKKIYKRKNLPVFYNGNIIGYYEYAQNVVLNSVQITP